MRDISDSDTQYQGIETAKQFNIGQVSVQSNIHCYPSLYILLHKRNKYAFDLSLLLGNVVTNRNAKYGDVLPASSTSLIPH